MKAAGLVLLSVSCTYDYSALQQPFSPGADAGNQEGPPSDRQTADGSKPGSDVAPTPDAGSDASPPADASPVDTGSPEASACNEVTNEGCDTSKGYRCVIQCSSSPFLICRMLGIGKGKDGEPCMSTADCGIGLTCAEPLGVPVYRCVQYCKTSTDCPAGEYCKPHSAPGTCGGGSPGVMLNWCLSRP